VYLLTISNNPLFTPIGMVNGVLLFYFWLIFCLCAVGLSALVVGGLGGLVANVVSFLLVFVPPHGTPQPFTNCSLLLLAVFFILMWAVFSVVLKMLIFYQGFKMDVWVVGV